MYKISILITILCMSVLFSFSQSKEFGRPKGLDAAQRDTLKKDSTSKIRMIGKYSGTEIKLRWMPATFEYWERFNKSGYILERLWTDTIGNNSKGFERMNNELIKPWPYEKMLEYLKKPNMDEYVAVVAQCIYGETDKSEFKNWTDLIDDKQNRYLFTMLAGEYSVEAATASGLTFIDKDVAPGRSYQYRLSTPGNGPRWRDTIYFYISTFEKDTIIQPIISVSKVQDGHIIIGWDRDYHRRFFSGYYIERSEDGKNFVRMNKKPYVNPQSESLTLNSDLITWKDTSALNYKKYHYRIIGITSFAELSKPSASVTLKSIDKTPPSQPFNISTKHLGGSRVEITWEYNGKEPDLAGFMIGRSKVANEGFDNISGDKPLPKNIRKYIDEKCTASSTNFYVVAAVDTAGNASASLISYAAIIDTFPPSKPLGLDGSIDTNGVITLKWPLGKDKDIKGYLIHTSNDRNHVFTCTTGEAVRDTVWRDTISLNTLTKKIYFKIQAVDLVDNISVFSDILELSKPDIVPPVKPFIYNYKVEPGAIILQYQPSTSKDLAYHIIKRRMHSETKWKEIHRIKDRDLSSFKDENIEEDKEYLYTMVAVDSTGNISDEATAISLKTLKDLKNPIKDLKAIVDNNSKSVRLSWFVDQNAKYKEVIIFKSVNKGPFISQLKLEAKKNILNEYLDKGLTNNGNIEYTTKVIFNNDMTSGFSPIVLSEMKKN